MAIIGAGLSGLTLANQLMQIADITVFEKARGPGGRMATRRASPFEFDHGAQFFTTHSQAFADFIQPMLDNGIVKRWDARFCEFDGKAIIRQRVWDDTYPHYVGAPSMNAIGKYLARDIHLNSQTEVTFKRVSDGWQLMDAHGQSQGVFDWVICTAPLAQTRALLPDDCAFLPALADIQMQACFSLMLGFDVPLSLPFDSALIHGLDISWISVNSSKPDRNTGYSLLVHATNAWADTHLEMDMDDVIAHLSQQTSDVLQYDVRQAKHMDCHRWRYANIVKQSGPSYFIDADQQLAAAGDWCEHGRIEAAFDSARQLALALKRHLA